MSASPSDLSQVKCRPARTAQSKQWSSDHLKLLYILWRFARSPSCTDHEEKWLRSLPFQVIVFEAIRFGILNFDYAPVCTNIFKDGRSRRVWMNTSQDARAAIDDLREHDLVSALKTLSEDFQSSTAFQVTALADSLLKTALSNKEKQKIDAFLYQMASPSTSDSTAELDEASAGLLFFESDLIQILFSITDGTFRLVKDDGAMQISAITQVEEISYVSSPYLPRCLMRVENKLSSNSRLANRSREGVNLIKDELSFALVLSRVQVMIGEWIPFGPNWIVSLNERFGSLNRCQGGLFTSQTDGAPTSTCLELSTGLTKISILDFEFDSFTNFEADIYIPHSEGLVQIESFGMHVNGNGSTVYGLLIESILDQDAGCVCVDYLARLLVDVDLDSSKIIHDLLSPHQRDIMNMLFMEDSSTRNKFSLIVAESITPALPAQDYLDRAEMENELKQIIGETHSVYDLHNNNMIIIGRDGMLAVGPECSQYEELIISHLNLLSRELFIRCFFRRTFILDSTLNQARGYITAFEQDPEALNIMREKIHRCSHDLILLEETLELLRDSIHKFQLPDRPESEAGMNLYAQLKLEKTLKDLAFRCKDLAKLLRGFRAKLKQIQCQNGTVSKTKLEALIRQVQLNIKSYTQTSEIQERSVVSSSDILLVLFACSLTCSFLDHIAVVSEMSSSTIATAFMRRVISKPLFWIVLNLFCMLCVVWALKLGLEAFTNVKTQSEFVTYSLCRKLNVVAFEAFLNCRDMDTCSCTSTDNYKLIHVAWTTRQNGFVKWNKGFKWRWSSTYRTKVTYDASNDLLMNVAFEGKMHPTHKSIFVEFVTLLFRSGCFDDEIVAATPIPKTAKSRKLTLMERILSTNATKVLPSQ